VIIRSYAEMKPSNWALWCYGVHKKGKVNVVGYRMLTTFTGTAGQYVKRIAKPVEHRGAP
jgi:hypothetical protein